MNSFLHTHMVTHFEVILSMDVDISLDEDLPAIKASMNLISEFTQFSASAHSVLV